MTDLPPIEYAPQDCVEVAIVAAQIEAHRKQQNERDAMQALARWKGDQYRPRARG